MQHLQSKKVGIVIVTYGLIPNALVESIGDDERIKYYVHHHGSAGLVDGIESLFSNKNCELNMHFINRGLSKSWNDGIAKSFHEKNELTLVINDDVEFYPGQFDAWVDFISHNQDAGLVFCSGNEPQDDGSVVTRSQDFACFSFQRAAYDTIGRFDEDFAPAYYEDFDYMARCRRSGLRVVSDPSVRVIHRRSTTVRNNPEIASTIDESYEKNHQLFKRKWGRDSVDDDIFLYPYNNPENSIFMPFTNN
jgi:GT2 family glycosyltransferase